VKLLRGCLTEGIEKHVIDGVPAHITNLQRTVADCSGFIGKIGLNVEVSALRESGKAGRVTIDEVWRYAPPYRVSNVVRPYFERLKPGSVQRRVCPWSLVQQSDAGRADRKRKVAIQ
jgi:hypothetical protein